MARGNFNVKLPETTGNSDFERIFRVHMNTLEWMPTFLVPLWLCAIYLNDTAAAVLGLVDLRPRLVFCGLQKSCRETLTRLLHPIGCMPHAVRGRNCGHRHAAVAGRLNLLQCATKAMLI